MGEFEWFSIQVDYVCMGTGKSFKPVDRIWMDGFKNIIIKSLTVSYFIYFFNVLGVTVFWLDNTLQFCVIIGSFELV